MPISNRLQTGDTRHGQGVRDLPCAQRGITGRAAQKAQVADNVDGVVLDHSVVKGNPADAPMLVPAIERIAARFGKAPKAVTADRGYGEAKVDAELEALGVERVAIPRKGRPGAARQQVQRGKGFTKLVKWRTGSEARISCLKRDFGWRRTLMDGLDGAETWCGWGVLAHNSVKVSRLIEAKGAKSATAARIRSPRPTATSPPGEPPTSRTAA
jgi:IS5 family transposase